MSDNGATSTSVPPGGAGFGRIAIIGAGAWGTALAAIAQRGTGNAILWGRDPEVVAGVDERRENARYLEGVTLPEGLRATTDLGEALAGAEAVMLVVPSHTLRAICAQMRPLLPEGIPLAVCAKGIEKDTGLLLAEVAGRELPGHPVGAISGPTFAREAALGHPTAATVAFQFSYEDRLDPSSSTAARYAYSLGSETFRPYVSDDLTSVEIGGAVKNVIAIACGMMNGAGFAENTRAVLITRGLEEMSGLAAALGGRRETVSGLSGAGDLVLTCSSTTSRNMSLGMQLGQGLARAECFEGRPVVVEGEVNALSVVQLARRIGVTMPICEAVHAILHEGVEVADAFAALWARPLRSESNALDISMSHPSQSDQIKAFAERML